MNSPSPSPSPPTLKEALLPTVLVVAVLYFGREFFIPLALATLIAFLLSPLIFRLERMHLGRVASVIIAALLAFSILGGIAYTVGGQMVELARDLPGYKHNLEEKVRSLRVPQDGALSKAKETLQDLTKEMMDPGEKEPHEIGKVSPADAKTGSRTLKSSQPIPVTVVSMPASPEEANPAGGALQTLENFITPLLGPLGTAALVIVFVIFIMLDREDLRDRIIHLVGRGHLQVTTTALDEAASRVSRYLLAQTMVNACYGVPIGIGLYFLHIPNSYLWGLLAIVLRFIPYLGSWIASAFPLILSLAVTSGWTTPILTLGLFIVVELGTANIIEPWLYGASTGLSSMAVIISAAFWTWLWGPVGLLLATPLTVCIAVLGKYIPNLSFLDVLLGDRPPIAPEDRFYQRLLANDEDEVSDIAERYCDKHSLPTTFERLMVPAMNLVDEDFHHGELLEPDRNRMYQLMNDLVNDLGDEPKEAPAGEPSVVCIPASDYADEVVAHMLARLLGATGVSAQVLPSKLLASESIEAAAAAPTRLFVISIVPPGSSRHGVYVAKRLRERLPECRILVGLWGEPAEDPRGRIRRFQRVRVDGLFTSLQEMAKEILATARVEAAPETPAPALTDKAAKAVA